MNRPGQALSIASECVPNISERGRHRRLVGGFVVTGFMIVLFVALWSRHADTALFLLILPPALVASLYFFQVKERTCVVLAALGKREEDDGIRKARIAGEWLLAVKRQARKVWIETVATGVVVTLAALAFAWFRG